MNGCKVLLRAGSQALSDVGRCRITLFLIREGVRCGLSVRVDDASEIIFPGASIIEQLQSEYIEAVIFIVS